MVIFGLNIEKNIKKNIKGIFSLSLINAANYIFPIAIIPIVASKIGPEGYGLTSFAHYFVLFFTLFINYGFDYSATKDLAVSESSVVKEALFNKYISSKLYLFLISTIIFVLLIFGVRILSNDKTLFIYTYLINIGYLLTPSWFFQDKGKLHVVATINFLSKSISIPFLFLLIKGKNDYFLLNLILSFSQIISGICIFYYAVKKYELNVKLLSLFECIDSYKKGFYLFANSIVIHLYTSTNIVLLGFFSVPSHEIGIYSSSIRIISGLLTIVLFPATQFLFPIVTREFAINENRGIKLTEKIWKIILVISLFAFLSLFFTAPYIVELLFGIDYSNSVSFIKLMSPVIFLIATSNVFGMVGLINLGAEKIMFQITFLGSIFSVLLNSVLIPKYSISGASFSWILTELCIAILCLYFFVKFKKKSNG